MKSSKDRSRRRFLVVSTTGMGDTLMGTPALRALRESFPESEIHLLMKAKWRELLSGNPFVDRILTYRNNPVSRAFLLLETYPSCYDSVLVFHANDDIWKILRRVRYRICYNRQGYTDVGKRVIPLSVLPKHTILKRLALVEKAGGQPGADTRYEYRPGEKCLAWAASRMSRWGISAADFLVGLQLGAADDYKRWPLESFAAVARYLGHKYGAKFYLNASAQEQPLVRRFMNLVPDERIFQTNGISPSYSAALLRSCALFITPDTGPMHLAMALEVPVVALFCPTDAEITGPLAYRQSMAIQKPVPCRPCLVRQCPDNFCMRQISVEEVCRGADRLLAEHGPGARRMPP